MTRKHSKSEPLYEELADGRVRISAVESAVAGYPGWRTFATFVADADEARLVRLIVEHEDGNDAPELTARMLRAVRPEQIRQFAWLEHIRARITHTRYPVLSQKLGLPLDTRGIDRAKDDAVKHSLSRSPAKRGGRPVEWSDLQLAKLAQEYLKLVAKKSREPVKTLADREQYAASTIRGLLDTARRRKLLQSVGQGKAGGKLTKKALDLLEGNYQ